MTETRKLEGRCLCGAVEVRAIVSKPALHACHCDMCQRLTSGIYFSLRTEQEGLEASGPIRTFRSSDWAERAFCGTCGSSIWYGTVHDGARYLSAGLFENAGGAALEVEYFADMAPRGRVLAGDQKKMTREETIAHFMDARE